MDLESDKLIADFDGSRLYRLEKSNPWKGSRQTEDTRVDDDNEGDEDDDDDDDAETSGEDDTEESEAIDDNKADASPEIQCNETPNLLVERARTPYSNSHTKTDFSSVDFSRRQASVAITSVASQDKYGKSLIPWSVSPEQVTTDRAKSSMAIASFEGSLTGSESHISNQTITHSSAVADYLLDRWSIYKPSNSTFQPSQVQSNQSSRDSGLKNTDSISEWGLASVTFRLKSRYKNPSKSVTEAIKVLLYNSIDFANDLDTQQYSSMFQILSFIQGSAPARILLVDSGWRMAYVFHGPPFHCISQGKSSGSTPARNTFTACLVFRVCCQGFL